MAKVAKKPAVAVEKKSVVTKTIAKTKPAQKDVVKKVLKAEKKGNSAAVPGIAKPQKEKMGISGKYTKEKAPKTPATPDTPVKAKQKKTAAKHRKKAKKGQNRGVVKISSLPHGFYEDQLKGYFTQFGVVTNAKVVRSLKTGRSKGVAFVEFAVPEVAEVAAETMNNYLLFKSLLKTEYIPPAQVKSGLFTKKVEVVIKADGTQVVRSQLIADRKAEVNKMNKTPTEEQIKKRQLKFENKIMRKNRFLASIGVKVPESSLTGAVIPSRKPVKKQKQQKITVKVSNDEPKAKVAAKPKEDKKVPEAVIKVTVQKAQPEKTREKKDTKKKKLEKPSTPTKAKVASKAQRSPKKEAKKTAAKAKKQTAVVAPVPVAAPAPVPAPEKKAKKAPAAAVKAVAPKAKQVKAAPVASPEKKKAKKNEAPKAKAEKVKVVKEKEVKEKKVAVKKTIEKKKPVKVNAKKSVK